MIQLDTSWRLIFKPFPLNVFEKAYLCSTNTNIPAMHTLVRSWCDKISCIFLQNVIAFRIFFRKSDAFRY